MEKIKIKTEKINIHQFYCDNCNKFLGESEEYDDGYVYEIGEFKEHFRFAGQWYSLRKTLCEDCQKKLIENIKKSLKELGFEEE